MDYEFGDIIDFRRDPKVSHFRLIFGLDEQNGKIIFETITSRTYRAFCKLCLFFNNYCINSKCSGKHFKHFFKENEKEKITPVSLSDVFFLDQKIYSLSLTEDSMIIINRDLRTEDIEVFDELYKDKRINHVNRLSKEDMERLYSHIKTSKYVSSLNLNCIGRAYRSAKKVYG